MIQFNHPIIRELHQQYDALQGIALADLFREDSERFSRFSMEELGLFMDFSKNSITEYVVSFLCQFADAQKLGDRITDLFSSRVVNTSEDQPAEHMLLRDFSLSRSRDAFSQIEQWVQKIESMGITDVVHLGIGGSDLGPRFVCDAFLTAEKKGIDIHFLSSPDATDVHCLLDTLNPKTTLFLVASKSFSTQETMINMKNAEVWLSSALNKEAVEKRIIIITSNNERAQAAGIANDYIVTIWPTVGGRYSLWSAMGLVIALKIGVESFKQLLLGAARMDQHFRSATWRNNMPVMLALISFWYTHFFKYPTHAVIPYSQRLRFFPDYLQQLHMESLGKSVNQSHEFLDYPTSPILWGGVGTDCQHSFHQLFMQGTHKVPIDFILPLARGVTKTDDYLIAHCLAQSEVLMMGYHSASLPYQHISGNNPSTLIMMSCLDPETLGALIALYEHKVFVNAVLWDINPFDQWGVDQGKTLARVILNELASGDTVAHDSSTAGLIKRILCTKR